MGLFSGRVVVVTGAGNGIGREEALAFAREGASVVVNDVGAARDGQGRDARVAEAVAAEIVAAGGQAIAAPGSVAELDDAEGVIWTAIQRFKRVDVLVNNAGILRDRSLVNMSVAEWDAVVAVHLRGTFLMTRCFARAIKAQGPAPYAVVNTSSLSGLIGNFGQANYGAAKAGIFGFTRVASLELHKLGCRVNAIAPVALTRMTAGNDRLGELSAEGTGPQHIAPVVTWLASDLAKDVNGRVFGVEGTHVFEYAMAMSPGLDKPSVGDRWTPETLQASLPRFAHGG